MPIPHHSSDQLAIRFHAQFDLLHTLIDKNTQRLESGKNHWDDWFDRIAKLPPDAQVFFPEAAATVAEIETAAVEISEERDRMFTIRDEVMMEKIRQLSRASATSGLSIGERIASDFGAFSSWRKKDLDGVDCEMFHLIDQRRPSAKPSRGRSRPLFDTLFIEWSKASGIPVKEAEIAAIQKRDDDIYEASRAIVQQLDDDTLHQVRSDINSYGFSLMLGDVGHRLFQLARSAPALKAIEEEVKSRSIRDELSPRP